PPPPPPPPPPPFPYTTLFRSIPSAARDLAGRCQDALATRRPQTPRSRSGRHIAESHSQFFIRNSNFEIQSPVGQENPRPTTHGRSEEHTSELQSRGHLVCRLL